MWRCNLEEEEEVEEEQDKKLMMGDNVRWTRERAMGEKTSKGKMRSNGTCESAEEDCVGRCK